MKSALCVWGGWEGHQPKKCIDILVSWLEEDGFAVESSNSLDVYADQDKMQSKDLVVQSWTMGELTREQEAGLTTAVKNGTGMAGCHAGVIDAFRNSPMFQFMMGGQFVYHPPNKPIDFQVKIVNRSDPITSGINDFRMSSEPYYLHYDPAIEILATMQFGQTPDAPWIEGTVVPTIWKNTFGKGRVFCNSLGHVPEEFQIPQVKEITRRGMLWAARD